MVGLIIDANYVLFFCGVGTNDILIFALPDIFTDYKYFL
jgi:hypothetical protein